MKPVQTQLARLLQTALPQARAELTVLPDAPQIALYLLNEDFSRAPLSPEAVQAVWDRPAYWAFCWASGQVLATILLQQPAWAAGKTVLDFGSGSGVVAIAAALAGAARVIACDIDPDAQVAIRSNAGHNHVNVEIRYHFFKRHERLAIREVARSQQSFFFSRYIQKQNGAAWTVSVGLRFHECFRDL